MSLPIAWVLKDKHVLLVGGGEVAETRVRKLVPNEAKVTIIAPSATEYIQSLADEKKVNLMKRRFKMSDLDLQHWSFVLTAIDDHETSKKIATTCRAQHIPINVADVIPLCDFYFGANFEQGPLKVMVSTGSGAPRLAKRILNELSNHASEFKFGQAISKVQLLRTKLRESLPGDDPQISQTRMLLMKTLCDKLSFPELAALKEEEMAPLIKGMTLSLAACPAHPIGEMENAEDFKDEPKTKADGDSRAPKNESAKELIDSESSSDSESSDSEDDSSDGSDDSENSEASDSAPIGMDEDKTTSDSHYRGMKRKATECAPGHPRPPVPPYPFKQQL